MRLLLCLALAAPSLSAQATANKLDALHDLSASLETLSHKVSRSVVQIFANGYSLGESGETGAAAAMLTRQRATGSGVILSADGYIVTNGHVVSNARSVRVRLAGETPGRSTLQPA